MTVSRRFRWLAATAVAFLIVFGAYAQNIGTFKDRRDGKTYRTVKIDKMVWMAENLNYDAKGSKCYDNKAENCDKYGRLYDWETANKACPAGFHLPSNDEWTALVDYAGGWENAGKKLKSKAGWNNNGNGTDDYGWSALPGGIGNSDGGFYDAGYYGLWWSATVYDAFEARGRGMNCDGGDVDWYDDDEEANLFSVRCVKD